MFSIGLDSIVLCITCRVKNKCGMLFSIDFDRLPSKHTTLQKRRCNVVTMQRRCNDVPARLCVCWVVVYITCCVVNKPVLSGFALVLIASFSVVHIASYINLWHVLYWFLNA